MRRTLHAPRREYLLIAGVSLILAVNFFVPGVFAITAILWAGAVLGALPTAYDAFEGALARKITIDAFNLFALIVSFLTGQVASAAFIVLMLAFARLLDWRTASRTRDAVQELLRLKPEKARRLHNGAQGDAVQEVPVEAIRKNDLLLAEDGDRIPADGVIVFGKAFVNESPVTGESVPLEKREGDRVISGTLVESGTIKFKATRVGADSTLERMAVLVRDAQKNKSRSERLADRFAAIFLPIVLVGGVAIYFITGNIVMTAAFFLVACADDMAVAIPLAITAALGRAAQKGVIVKGGEWLDVLQRAKTLVLDKTGTLTYGNFEMREAEITGNVTPEGFWRSVAVAEKFSEHPVGRAIFKAAAKKMEELVPEQPLPDPDDVQIHEGEGIWIRYGGLRRSEVAIGDLGLAKALGIGLDPAIEGKIKEHQEKIGGTTVIVWINKQFSGVITVADLPREEAAASIRTLRGAGLGNIIMFTGDNEKVAAAVAERLGIASYMASMLPEDKMRRLAEFDPPVVMVGDGVNDAPALARADVGIAMGSAGAGVSVEAADIVILTDNLARIPEMVALGQQTSSVIKWDIVIWIVTNLVGFGLVLTGFAGPALAAFYNFATDFLPLANSARLFTES